MQQDIIKLCADSLRSFTLEKYGIKLKAAHAHELAATFFGYKSKNALLSDNLRPIKNLLHAEFIVFDPSPQNTGYADQRLKDLGYKYLNAFHMADCFYYTLRKEEFITSKIYVSFREVALQVAERYLCQRLKVLGIKPGAIEWDIDGDMYCWEQTGNALLKAKAGYFTNSQEYLRYSEYKIHLPRIAANLGYGVPMVEETYYSGNAAKYSDEELLRKYPVILTPAA